MLTLDSFLTTFFDDPAYAAPQSLVSLKDFAWGHMRNHSAVILNQQSERVSVPYNGCWIFEYGIFSPSLYAYKEVPSYFVSYYHDESRVYPVFCIHVSEKE